jgi:hypothetical protein
LAKPLCAASYRFGSGSVNSNMDAERTVRSRRPGTPARAKRCRDHDRFRSGAARRRARPDRARALWNERQKVWWSGPDDPNIRVVRVEPEQAEMWDGPANSAMAALEFAKARLTGERPQLGENRKIAVDMG